MKTSTIPVICGIALTAMSTAGLSHWWSVRQFIAVMDHGAPVPALEHPAAPQTPQLAAVEPAKAMVPVATKAPSPVATQPAAPQSRQKEFYEALITKIESLQNQNRDLLDQVAETNRDLMKLEFRVDTHSEQFRPLPVSEDRPDTSFEDDVPGVLPPRAEPVMLPVHE